MANRPSVLLGHLGSHSGILAMANPIREHAARVPDDGRETAAWTALAFGILFVCVFALHIIADAASH